MGMLSTCWAIMSVKKSDVVDIINGSDLSSFILILILV